MHLFTMFRNTRNGSSSSGGLSTKASLLLLMSLYLGTGVPVAKAQNEGTGHLARLEITDAGIKKIVEKGIANFKGRIERLLGTLQPQPFIMGADPVDCAPEKVEHMWLWQAWQYCPGIPEFLMPGSLWKNGLRPHPIQVLVNDPRFKALKLGEATMECRHQLCTLIIPIKRFVLGGDVEIRSLKTKEKLLDTKGIDLRLISEKETGTTDPYMVFKIKLDQNGDMGKAISVLPKETHMELGDAQAGLYFENGPEIIQLGDRGVEKYLQDHLQSFPEPSQLKGFVQTAHFINQFLLKLPFFRNQISRVLLHRVGHWLLDWANESFKDLPLIGRTEVTAPNFSVQNLIEEDAFGKIEKRVKEALREFNMAYDAFISSSRSQLPVIIPFSVKFKSFREKLDAYLSSLSIIPGPLPAEGMQELQKMVHATCMKFTQDLISHLDQEKNVKQIKFKRNRKLAGSLLQPNIIDCNMALADINRSQTMMEEISKNRNINYQLKLALSKSLGPKTAMKINLLAPELCALPHVYDVDHEVEDFDFSVDISLAAINAYLEKMQRNGEFNFCLNYSGQEDLCRDGKKELGIKFSVPPRLQWDQAAGQLYLEIPEAVCSAKVVPGVKCLQALETNGMAYAKVYFNPSVCHGGQLCLNPAVESGAKLFIKQGLLANVRNAIKAITILHPLVTDYFVKSNVNGLGLDLFNSKIELQKIKIDDEIEIPSMTFEKVFTRAEGIKIYLKIKEEPSKAE